MAAGTFQTLLMSGLPTGIITFTDHDTNGAGATTYTFTSKAIGAAASNRVVIVSAEAFAGNTNRTISSLTIGGTAANQQTFQQSTDGIISLDIGIYSLLVPTGTTATIVVTWSGAQSECGIGVWAANITSGTATATATSVANPYTESTLAIPSLGVAVGAVISYAASAPTYTWTNMTEDFDETLPASAATHTGAHTSSVAGSTPTLTCTPTTFTEGRAVWAAFH